ncbi:MAG: ABC transporter permease [Pseudomonadota bacterium]
MKSFIALLVARNKEFYRDKGSLAWAVLFPVMAIIGCTLVFSSEQNTLFSVGVLNDASTEQAPLLQQPFIKPIGYTTTDKALQRVKQHQLHAFVDVAKNTVWVNVQSSQGSVIKQLSAAHMPSFSVKETTGKAIRYIDWVLPGILGMNIMFGALFGVGYVIVRYRKNGVLKRLNATPVTAMQFLSAQIVSRLLIILTANTAIFIAAIVLLDLTMIGSYVSLFIVSVLGGFALVSIGLIISSRTDSEELAGGLLNLLTWPMMFLSGVWFSLDAAPTWLQALTDVFPLTHLINASRDIMLNGATLIDVTYECTVLGVMSIVFLAIGAYLFRWNH